MVSQCPIFPPRNLVAYQKAKKNSVRVAEIGPRKPEIFLIEIKIVPYTNFKEILFINDFFFFSFEKKYDFSCYI